MIGVVCIIFGSTPKYKKDQILELKKIKEERPLKKQREQQELERKQQELEQKQQLERGTIEKIKKMVRVSNTISLDMMRKSLNMPEELFLEKIYDWAADFNFKIDGNNLLINQDTVGNFMNALDKQFEDWGKKEAEKTQKRE